MFKIRLGLGLTDSNYITASENVFDIELPVFFFFAEFAQLLLSLMGLIKVKGGQLDFPKIIRGGDTNTWSIFSYGTIEYFCKSLLILHISFYFCSS